MEGGMRCASEDTSCRGDALGVHRLSRAAHSSVATAGFYSIHTEVAVGLDFLVRLSRLLHSKVGQRMTDTEDSHQAVMRPKLISQVALPSTRQ